MNLLRVVVASVIFCALATKAPADEKIDPKALLGVWEVTKVNFSIAKIGWLYDFRSAGVLILTAKQKDRAPKFDMIYKLDGATLSVESKIATGGKPNIATITRLTDKEMIWSAPDGKTVELRKKK